MIKMHCDICDAVIDGDYYTFTRHDASNFETHKDVCIECWQSFMRIRGGVKSGMLKIVFAEETEGEWLEHNDDDGERSDFYPWECSQCHEASEHPSAYCSACGVKMKSKEST